MVNPFDIGIIEEIYSSIDRTSSQVKMNWLYRPEQTKLDEALEKGRIQSCRGRIAEVTKIEMDSPGFFHNLYRYAIKLKKIHLQSFAIY